jgi:chorismate mutase
MDVTLLTSLSLAATMKVVHSVLDSMNRRRQPSKEILLKVDGPKDADQIVGVARLLLQQIEADEGYSLATMPLEIIQKRGEELLAVADAKLRNNLPAADESRARALLDNLRKASASAG